jgi:hypothetical protein
VRVRRLLSRLEFLSELPEKLSEMIEKEVRVKHCYIITIKLLLSVLVLVVTQIDTDVFVFRFILHF